MLSDSFSVCVFLYILIISTGGYVGECIDGIPNGEGIVLMDNGDVLYGLLYFFIFYSIGVFDDALPNGFCILNRSNGDVLKGDWYYGKPSGEISMENHITGHREIHHYDLHGNLVANQELCCGMEDIFIGSVMGSIYGESTPPIVQHGIPKEAKRKNIFNLDDDDEDEEDNINVRHTEVEAIVPPRHEIPIYQPQIANLTPPHHKSPSFLHPNSIKKSFSPPPNLSLTSLQNSSSKNDLSSLLHSHILVPWSSLRLPQEKDHRSTTLIALQMMSNALEVHDQTGFAGGKRGANLRGSTFPLHINSGFIFDNQLLAIPPAHLSSPEIANRASNSSTLFSTQKLNFTSCSIITPVKLNRTACHHFDPLSFSWMGADVFTVPLMKFSLSLPLRTFLDHAEKLLAVRHPILLMPLAVTCQTSPTLSASANPQNSSNYSRTTELRTPSPPRIPGNSDSMSSVVRSVRGNVSESNVTVRSYHAAPLHARGGQLLAEGTTWAGQGLWWSLESPAPENAVDLFEFIHGVPALPSLFSGADNKSPANKAVRKRSRRLSPGRAAHIGAEIVSGLLGLAEKGIYHCCLTPYNVLIIPVSANTRRQNEGSSVRNSDTVRVCINGLASSILDFDYSQESNSRDGDGACNLPVSHSSLARSSRGGNLKIGSRSFSYPDGGLSSCRLRSGANWASPELLRGTVSPFANPLEGEESVAWTIGVLLWEMLTGLVPYGGLTVDQIWLSVGWGGLKLPVDEQMLGDNSDSLLLWTVKRCLRIGPGTSIGLWELMRSLREVARQHKHDWRGTGGERENDDDFMEEDALDDWLGV